VVLAVSGLDRAVDQAAIARLALLLATLALSCGISPEARLRKVLASQTTGIIRLPKGTVEISSELILAPGAHDLEIVGVARNARYGDMKQEIPPVLYVSYMQGYLPFDEVTYTLRTTNNPLAYVKIVREIVHQADPYVPVDSIRTQSGEIDRTIRREITFARLSTAFALLALMIACIGLYGTMSYRVARRTGEIGVRVALGARRSTIIWMVLREVLILTAVGLLVSVPVAFWTSRLLESLLFRTRPSDLSELLLASLTLLGSACLAGYLPARKASKIDPMAALRHE